MACGQCRKLGKCVLEDAVNPFVEKAREAQGFVFGSPGCIYAHPSGRILSFLDRAFFSGSATFAFKPAAAVLSARRAGTTASFDVLNKYFTISSMPVVSATYWNHVYGSPAGGGAPGSGGADDHVQHRQEHGLAAEVPGNGRAARPAPSGESQNRHQFHSIKAKQPGAGLRAPAGLCDLSLNEGDAVADQGQKPHRLFLGDGAVYVHLNAYAVALVITDAGVGYAGDDGFGLSPSAGWAVSSASG